MSKRGVTWPAVGALFFACFVSMSGMAWAQEECFFPSGSGQLTYAVSWGSGVLKVLTSNDEVIRGQYVEAWVESGIHGCPPYTWEVTGTGFRFGSVSGPTSATTGGDGVKVQLWANSSACGSATIVVTDGCNQPVNAYVRCTSAGTWVYKGNICGGLTVPADTDWYSPPYYYYQKVEGNKRVLQQVDWSSGSCNDPGPGCCDEMYDAQYTKGEWCSTIGCNQYGFADQGRCISTYHPICECFYEAGAWECYWTRELTYSEWECQ